MQFMKKQLKSKRMFVVRPQISSFMLQRRSRRHAPDSQRTDS